MSSNLKSVIFAVVLCFVCSLLLTAAASGLKEFHHKNIVKDRHKNILKSVGLIPAGATYAATDIEKRYQEYIKPLWVNPSGRIVPEQQRGQSELPIYLYRKKNKIEAYIVPINSRGLWGKIHGYLALKNDGETISGFTVYHHSETPGLGGEIEKRWFQENFVGKKIVDSTGRFVSISIAKGVVKEKLPLEKQINYVDGISGATLTGKYLSSGLKEILLQYEPVAIKFRKNRIDNTAIGP